jgi:hypothetical protein
MIYAMLDGENITGFTHSDLELPLSKNYILFPESLALENHLYRVIDGEIIGNTVDDSAMATIINFIPDAPIDPAFEKLKLLEDKLKSLEKRIAGLEKGTKDGAK